MIKEVATVQTQHKDYIDAYPKWALVRNFMTGDVKGYLRNVGANEPTLAEQVARQDAYEDGAFLLNFLARTISGMIGGVFRKTPTIEFPTSLEYLLTNADGNHQGVAQQSQEVLRNVLETGRVGLFVDVPKNTQTNLKADIDGINDPRILSYPAESVINWRTKSNGSVNIISLIVLAEEYEYQDAVDDFLYLTATQYRVLDFDENGYYRQRVFKFDNTNVQIGEAELFEPLMRGERMKEIPFIFIGSENNTHTVDEAPAYSLAVVNKAHYRNTADNEEQLFVCSQIMLALFPDANTSPEDWHKLNPNGVKFGSRQGLVVPGGSAALLQGASTNALSEAIKQKEEQAQAIGAQLISPTKVITAESARLQRGADTSVLANTANNVSEGYTRAIKICDEFKGGESEFVFELNTDFFLSLLTAQDRAQWVSEVNMGITPKALYYKRLREAEEYPADWTDEMIEEATTPMDTII